MPAGWRARIRTRVPTWLPWWAIGDHAQPKLRPTVRLGSQPELALTLNPLGASGRSVGWPIALAIGVVTGLLASLVVPLSVGGLVAALVVAGLLVPPMRWVSTAGAFGFIAAGCVNVIAGQATSHFLPGSNWAGSFVKAGNLIWVGVVLLLADAVIIGVSIRAGGRPPAPTPPTSDEPSPPT